MKTVLKIILPIFLTLSALQVQAQQNMITLSFEDAPLDMVVEMYREWTGRIIIKQADLTAKVTLKGSQLTKEEAMQAIESLLANNGIALVPMGDKFLKVVPIANARQEGMPLQPFNSEEGYAQSDQLISQVIPLRYVIFADVQPLIQHLVHGYGKIQQLDRVNSVLVTDTSANIARIVELINIVDQPAEKIEPRIYQLKYAEAATIAAKLKELVEAAKTKKGEQTVVAGDTRTIPGVIRAPRAGPAAPGGGRAEIVAEEQTEMIVGDVKIVSDDRTNMIIVFSKAANFDFFDNIIKVLDIPVDAAVVVETIKLEYATSKEISGILNEFIGAAKATEKSKAPGTGSAEGSKTVDEVIERSTDPVRPSDAAKEAIGRLSADTKIISDERTNSLILMGRKSDILAIKEVIASLDVMLQQVKIEAVILSVGLGDSIQTGVQWVYQNLPEEKTLTYVEDVTTNGVAFRKPVYIPAKVLNRTGFVADDLAKNLAENMLSGALSYYGAFPNLNLQVIANAAKRDSDARILSTPVVMTTDNTEAKITVGEERPVVSSSINSSSDGYSARATYEYRNIGITLTVTPHINPSRDVVMEITQTANDVGGEVSSDGNQVPVISKREITATVAVRDRQTIVLGGLVRKANSKSATKIPILGDIPLLGWLFSTHSKSEDRSELVVLLTPSVMTNPVEAEREAERLYNASDSKNTLWPLDWS